MHAGLNAAPRSGLFLEFRSRDHIRQRGLFLQILEQNDSCSRMRLAGLDFRTSISQFCHAAFWRIRQQVEVTKMAEVVSQGPVLSDSMFKTRPRSDLYYMSDANVGGNSVQHIEERRSMRQMKFPSLYGRKDVDSFRSPQNPTDVAFTKWNDAGNYRSPAPLRSCDNIIDPISGFVSPAGDVDRNTGHTRIKSLVQLSTTPQSYAPKIYILYASTVSLHLWRHAGHRRMILGLHTVGTRGSRWMALSGQNWEVYNSHTFLLSFDILSIW